MYTNMKKEGLIREGLSQKTVQWRIWKWSQCDMTGEEVFLAADTAFVKVFSCRKVWPGWRDQAITFCNEVATAHIPGWLLGDMALQVLADLGTVFELLPLSSISSPPLSFSTSYSLILFSLFSPSYLSFLPLLYSTGLEQTWWNPVGWMWTMLLYNVLRFSLENLGVIGMSWVLNGEGSSPFSFMETGRGQAFLWLRSKLKGRYLFHSQSFFLLLSRGKWGLLDPLRRNWAGFSLTTFHVDNSATLVGSDEGSWVCHW